MFGEIAKSILVGMRDVLRDLNAKELEKIEASVALMEAEANAAVVDVTNLDALFASYARLQRVREAMLFVATALGPEMLSRGVLLMSSHKLDLMRTLLGRMKGELAGALTDIDVKIEAIYTAVKMTKATPAAVVALGAKYGAHNLVVMLLERAAAEEYCLATTATSLGLNAVPSWHLLAVPGPAATFDLRGLLDQAYIISRGWEAVSETAGISPEAIAKTTTMTLLPGATNLGFPPAMDAQISCLKELAARMESLVIERNKPAITYEGLLDLQMRAATEQRQSKEVGKGVALEHISSRAGQHVLDSMTIADLGDVWRYKEVSTYYTNALRMGWKPDRASRAAVEHKQYIRSERPLSQLYEEAVERQA